MVQKFQTSDSGDSELNDNLVALVYDHWLVQIKGISGCNDTKQVVDQSMFLHQLQEDQRLLSLNGFRIKLLNFLRVVVFQVFQEIRRVGFKLLANLYHHLEKKLLVKTI